MKDKLIRWLGGYTEDDVLLNNLEKSLVGINDVNKNYQNMEGEDKSRFLKEMNYIFESEGFKLISKWIQQDQLVFTTCKASNYKQVTYGRAVITTFQLINEVLIKYNGEYLNSIENKEEFDVHELV